MLLTVAICTRNRAASLRRTLASLADCAPPPNAQWEVVVVDNGSADDTASVAMGFDGTLPVRVVSEATRGLSHARNAGVRAAQGEYLLWTDDDCVVHPRWLTAYATAVRRSPDAALFGGPIVPRFEGNPPAWLTRVAARVATAYAARDFGPAPVALNVEANVVPFGANYMIRSSDQRRRPYDTRLGRGASLPMSVGEESDVMRGLLRDGARGYWVPDAIVTHSIPPARQRVSYLREYFVANGAYEQWRYHTGSATAGGDDVSELQLARRAVRAEVRYRLMKPFTRPEAWIEDLIAASVARGRLRAKRTLRSG